MVVDVNTGPYFILTSAFFFSCMNLGVRLLKDTFPPDLLIFYRSLFQVIVLSFGLRTFLPKNRQELKRKMVVHFARGLFGVTSMLLLYASMQRLPIGLASLLAMSVVFWATLFSAIFLKERLKGKQIVWASVAVAGILIAVFHPNQTLDFEKDWIGIVAGLSAGLAAGGAFTVLRNIRQEIPTREIVFYFGCLGVLITGPMAALHFRLPETPKELFLILYISACATTAQLFMTHGFKDTTATLASLINLQQITFSVLLGIFFLNEWPEFYFYVGAVLVFLGLRNLIALQWKK